MLPIVTLLLDMGGVFTLKKNDTEGFLGGKCVSSLLTGFSKSLIQHKRCPVPQNLVSIQFQVDTVPVMPDATHTEADTLVFGVIILCNFTLIL